MTSERYGLLPGPAVPPPPPSPPPPRRPAAQVSQVCGGIIYRARVEPRPRLGHTSLPALLAPTFSQPHNTHNTHTELTRTQHTHADKSMSSPAVSWSPSPPATSRSCSSHIQYTIIFTPESLSSTVIQRAEATRRVNERDKVPTS